MSFHIQVSEVFGPSLEGLNCNADALSCILPYDVVNVIQNICTFDRMQQAQADNTCLQPIISALKNHQPLPTLVPLGLRQTFRLNGTLCHNFGKNVDVQVVVPEALKENILEHLHNRGGHLGIHKTTEKVK